MSDLLALQRRGTLQECSSADHARTELIVVEGRSAAAAVARARDRKTQAVFSLQGKPLNAAKASAQRVHRDPQLQALATALGQDLPSAEPLAKLRYPKLLLLFDPDADGLHCSALLQAFLAMYLPQLLREQRVALLRAPLARIHTGAHPEPIYAYSPGHLQGLQHELQAQGHSGFDCQHFKGVASLHSDWLSALCLHRERRQEHLIELATAERIAQQLGPGAAKATPSQRPPRT